MALERRWRQVSPRSFVEDGKENGEVVLNDTIYLRVKQKVVVRALGEDDLVLEVKRVSSPTRVVLGPDDNNINTRIDLTAYTVAKTASLSAQEQDKKVPGDKDQMKHSYEQEPILARRVIHVDPYGDFYTVSNPMPVQLSNGSIDIGTVNAELEVQLSHLDDNPNPGDIADSVRVGDGENILEINPDGSINTTSSPKTSPFIANINIANANTEETFQLPGNTKKFSFYIRDGKAKTLLSFNSGESGITYKTVERGEEYEEEGLTRNMPLDLYFQTTHGNVVAEILYWL